MDKRMTKDRSNKAVRYPEIAPRILAEDTLIKAEHGTVIGTIKDFWQWAYSNLTDNTVRGKLAEYFVACALGVQELPRQSWAEYDLLSREGIAVEVKASAYLQAWGQKILSRPIFGISETYGWNSAAGEFEKEQRRQADVYVFCLHRHTEQNTLDPLDLTQCEFYVLPTAVLNEKVPHQKTITLSTIRLLGAQSCDFNKLHETILAAAKMT